MKKKILFLTLIALFTLVSSQIYLLYSKEKIISVSAEWAYEAASVEDLFERSDLVVIGQAKEKRNKNGEMVYISPFDLDNTVIYTEYSLNINKVLKGNVSNKKSIDLINYGGLNENKEKVYWEGITQLDGKNLYLMFLEKIPNNPNPNSKGDPRGGKYRPIDGPSGTYLINADSFEELQNNLTQKSLESIANSNLMIKYDVELSVDEPQLNIQREVMNTGLQKIMEHANKNAKKWAIE